MSPSVDEIEQLDCTPSLLFQVNLKMDSHIKDSYAVYSVAMCPANVSAKVVEASVYASRQAQYSCTLSDCISYFTCPPIIGKFSVCWSEWKGWCILLRRLKRCRLIQHKADKFLFDNMCRPQHCVRHLLPPIRSLDYLRNGGHSFNLSYYRSTV